MDKINVSAINLEKRADRRASIVSEFADKEEFQLNIVPAIEHRIGAIGLWQTFISSDEPFCLIVEDNINLTKEQIEGFSECICGIPGDWDMFFPYDREYNEGRGDGIQILNPTSYEKHDYQPFLLGYEWGNSIYALTREGAYKLLREIKSIAFRLDDTIIRTCR